MLRIRPDPDPQHWFYLGHSKPALQDSEDEVEGVGGWLGAWEGEPQRRKQHNLKVFPLFSVVFRLYFLVLVLKLHNSLDLFFFFSMSILVLRIGKVLDADPDPDPLI